MPTRRYVSRLDLPPRPIVGPLDSHLCPGCGNPVPSRRKLHPGKAGRQAETCGPDCYRLVDARREYEAALANVTERMTPRRWAEERARMWRACNGRAWNRGVRLMVREVSS